MRSPALTVAASTPRAASAALPPLAGATVVPATPSPAAVDAAGAARTLVVRAGIIRIALQQPRAPIYRRSGPSTQADVHSVRVGGPLFPTLCALRQHLLPGQDAAARGPLLVRFDHFFDLGRVRAREIVQLGAIRDHVV
jgi:hypothetical protein